MGKIFIYYLPRGLAILMVAFAGLFVLEGFSPEFSWGDVLSHAVLALAVLVVTVVAWRWPRVGGWLFVLMSIQPLSAIRSAEWSGVIIGSVPLLTGILFLIEGFNLKSGQ